MAASQRPPGGHAPPRPGCSRTRTGSCSLMPEVAPFWGGDGSGPAAAARIGESSRLSARWRGLRGADRPPPPSRSLLLRWRKVRGCFGSGTAGHGGTRRGRTASGRAARAERSRSRGRDESLRSRERGRSAGGSRSSAGGGTGLAAAGTAGEAGSSRDISGGRTREKPGVGCASFSLSRHSAPPADPG